MFKRKKGNKAFTLIELIVVMAIIGILVLLALPNFLGRTREATATKVTHNMNQIEKASERYFINHQQWPRVGDPYSSDELTAYAQEIQNTTGEVIELDPEGNYYTIDQEALSAYVQLPDNNHQYILRNPVGKVYYLDGLTEEGEKALTNPQFNEVTKTGDNTGSTPTTWVVPYAGTYRIEVHGARGGKGGDMWSNWWGGGISQYGQAGQHGSVVTTELFLQRGEELELFQGRAGTTGADGSGHAEINTGGGTGGGESRLYSSTRDELIASARGGNGGRGGSSWNMTGGFGLNGSGENYSINDDHDVSDSTRGQGLISIERIN